MILQLGLEEEGSVTVRTVKPGDFGMSSFVCIQLISGEELLVTFVTSELLHSRVLKLVHFQVPHGGERFPTFLAGEGLLSGMRSLMTYHLTFSREGHFAHRTNERSLS